MVSASSVFAALAVLPSKDGTPRVVQQFTSVFLVSGRGELWRVFDCPSSDGTHTMPSAGSTLPVRIFVALARKAERRARTFAPHEPRDIDPVNMQKQLDESTAI